MSGGVFRQLFRPPRAPQALGAAATVFTTPPVLDITRNFSYPRRSHAAAVLHNRGSRTPQLHARRTASGLRVRL